ncbi:unnamed protein product, partial [Notodromas monacha]
MKLASAVELFLSIASVVLERREDLLKSGENVSLQELFLDGTTERSHRQGRIVVVPPMFTQNLCVFGLIFGVPLSFLIPVVRIQTSPDDEEDSEEDEDSRRRQDVDVDDDERDIVPPIKQQIFQEDESNDPGVAPFALANISAPRSFGDSSAELVEEYDLDLMHEDNLVTLNNYFDYMEVKTEVCKRRMICELAASPDSFYPVSDIMLRKIRPKATLETSENARKRSIFNKFLEASKIGFNGDSSLCQSRFSRCKNGLGEIIDANMLR